MAGQRVLANWGVYSSNGDSIILEVWHKDDYQIGSRTVTIPAGAHFIKDCAWSDGGWDDNFVGAQVQSLGAEAVYTDPVQIVASLNADNGELLSVGFVLGIVALVPGQSSVLLGGGGGGDASAANQQLQIAQETLTADALGVPPDPDTDTIIALAMENWEPKPTSRQNFTAANCNSAQSLTVPAGTIIAYISLTPVASVAGDATAGWVRYTFDGSTPSSTNGNRIRNGTLTLNPEYAVALKFISEAGATDVLGGVEYGLRP